MYCYTLMVIMVLCVNKILSRSYRSHIPSPHHHLSASVEDATLLAFLTLYFCERVHNHSSTELQCPNDSFTPPTTTWPLRLLTIHLIYSFLPTSHVEGMYITVISTGQKSMLLLSFCQRAGDRAASPRYEPRSTKYIVCTASDKLNYSNGFQRNGELTKNGIPR